MSSSGPDVRASWGDDRPRIRILIPGDTFPPNVNGAAKFTENLAVGMAARGHEVHVVAPAASRRHGTRVEQYEGQSIVVHRLPSVPWPGHDWLRFVLPWRARAHARRILDAVQPDVVHHQSVVVLGRAFTIEAQRRRLPIIATNHLMMENAIDHSFVPRPLRRAVSELWWKDASRTFARATAVTTPTRRAARFLEEQGRVRHVLAISCGIRTSDYAPDLGPKPDHRIVFVGRVTGEKQLDVLLAAVQQLSADLEVRLDIVGGGDQLHNLQRLAARLGIAERVTFHGYASDAELRGLLTRASVFAMPSIAELQSIATMEAMASGLPVVAADAMALPHLVHHGRTGYLFAPGDAADLAAKLRLVLTAPQQERARLGAEGLRLVQMHDIDRTFDLFERLYRGEPIAEVARDSVNEQDEALEPGEPSGAAERDSDEAAA